MGAEHRVQRSVNNEHDRSWCITIRNDRVDIRRSEYSEEGLTLTLADIVLFLADIRTLGDLAAAERDEEPS